jgi:cell division protease FtsH
MAMSLPEEDSYSRTRGWIEDRIVICYGGWIAEKLFYDETTTGTKQDIQQATDMARHMVCEWGMAEELGPIAYGQEDEPIFLGKEIARHKDYSEDTARRIDTAVKEILDRAKETARKILESRKRELEELAEALISRETLIDDEVRELLGLPPRENSASLTGKAAAASAKTAASPKSGLGPDETGAGTPRGAPADG